MDVYIGYDSREDEAYRVCEFSILENTRSDLRITPLVLADLMEAGLYTREPDEKASTEFVYSRFLVPHLMGYKDWAMFVDCDFVFTRSLEELWDMRDNKYAVMVVQHNYVPFNDLKMDGRVQYAYPRKNWSSLILFNCKHKSNKALTKYVVNTARPKYLHRFLWLDDKEIGKIPLEWNFLVGEYKPTETLPAGIHYTNGGPWFQNCKKVDYANVWEDYRDRWQSQVNNQQQS